MYAIIDIETTGGSSKTDKITEIAIFVHDGEKIVNEFATLVNPEKPIPYFITQLTGISNEMVENAPKFYEIAKEIVEITEGNIFVAHNVNFDYNFVREEFKNLGFTYKREQLCTVKLSRKIIPGYESYSLGKLCNNLNIEINGRHRAAGDALATVKLFEILLDKNKHAIENFPGLLSFKGTHTKFRNQLLLNAPEAVGVYYFYDEKGEIIYIGKSKNINKRVISHFNNTKTDRAIEMKGRIADISYELTGSELIALLFESAEIKEHKPVYNRAQRRTLFNYGLYSELNETGYKTLQIKKTSETEDIAHTSFTNMQTAKRQLFRWVEENKLCQKLCGLYESAGACFHHALGECNGACIHEEPVEEYNSRVDKLLRRFEYHYTNFFVFEDGKNETDFSVIKVENGRFKGYGYIDKENASNLELVHDCIKACESNRDTEQIIRTHLKMKQGYKVVHF